MMCSNCGKREANFMYTEIINGVKKEINLCSNCANKLGVLDMSFNMPSLDFSNFFGDFLNEYDSLMPSIFSDKVKTLKCTGCGMEYDEFLSTGKFGCSNCYEVFQDKIEPLLRQLHGDTKYLGKKSGNDFKAVRVQKASTKEVVKDENKIESLKERLKDAIKVENYEEAAKIRDEIKALEENEKKVKGTVSMKAKNEEVSNKSQTKGSRSSAKKQVKNEDSSSKKKNNESKSSIENGEEEAGE